MAEPSLVVRIAANLSDFRKALDEGKVAIDTTAAKMQNMARSFSGDALIRRANDLTTTITQLGGATTLTDAQKRNLNRTLTEAIQKYDRLGQEAPEAMRKLAADTHQATEKTSLLTRGAQALIAAVSIRAVANLAGDVLDLTGKLTDLSGKTGIGTEALQRLAYVTSQSGVSLDQVATGAVKMGRSLVEGDKAAVTAVKALGLNLDALIASGPERAFLTIGEAIARVPNPMEQAALATALFGKAGADYLPAFSAQMGQVADEAQRSGAILSADMVAAGDAAGDAFGRLQMAGMAVFAQVFLPLVPAIELAANWLGTALPAALTAAREGVDWLIRQGLELNVWLRDLAVSVSQTVADVPVLGRVFGQSAADLDTLKQQAQFARDSLNAFNVQGVQPVRQAVQTTAPMVTNFGEAMRTAGEKGAKAGRDVGIVWGEVTPIVRMQIAGVLSASLVEFETKTNNAERALAELRDEIYRVQGAAQQVGPVLANSMTLPFAQFAPTVRQATTEGEGFFSRLFGGAQGFGSSVSSIFQAAFTGGGGALGAVQSFATGTLSTLLGMIPGLGPFLSGFAGPIIAMFGRLAGRIRDFFRDLFGGPSRDELNGRNLVNEFEQNLHRTLSGTQLAEAGNESWARTVIAIRDAYIAAGRSEEEALADAERLWASSRQGAEASRAVIADIEAKMNASGAAAVNAVNRIGAAIDGLPDVVDIEFRGTYRGPNIPRGDEGYAGGTMGTHGSWFRDFGPGTATVLHGREAVVTPQQAPAFARAVLGGGGDEEMKRLLRDLPRAMKLALREALVMA